MTNVDVFPIKKLAGVVRTNYLNRFSPVIFIITVFSVAKLHSYAWTHLN
jgi:hypothetical protein